MKKKIKDLTLEEKNKFCKKYKFCGYHCPLYCGLSEDNFAQCKYSIKESEVEVDE